MDLKSRHSFEVFRTFCSSVLEYEERLKYHLKSQRLNGGFSVLETRDSFGPLSPGSASSSSISSLPDYTSDEVHRGSNLEAVAVLTPSTSRKRNNKQAGCKGDLIEDKQYSSGDESWNMVTCYCEKPFAGRPMIECASCETWLHLSCAKIRRSDIPDRFVCSRCRDKSPASSSKRLYATEIHKALSGQRSRRRNSKKKK